MKTNAWLCAAALVLASATGWAQNYVVQSQSLPYVGITGGTPITFTAHASFDATDEGYFALTLPFSFPYYGNTYTTVYIETNGFVLFGGPCGTGSCYANRAIPSTSTTMHNLIAPWWSDMDVLPPAEVVYSASAGQVEIEWRNVPQYTFFDPPEPVTFKLTLTPSGVFQVHYGTIAAGSGHLASAGFENSTGSMGASWLTCGASCTNSNFPSNMLFTIGQPVQPDLIVESVAINSVSASGGNLSLSVSPTFRNFGQNAGNGFLWRAYLSTDRFFQMTDTLFYTSTTPLNVAGGGTVSDTGMATIPAPPTGNYYVIVEVDHTNAVMEGTFGESNNYGATTNYFSQGVDLVATSISGPAMSGPGNSITLNLSYFNQGSTSAGNVGYRIYLSADTVWSTTDFQLYPAMGDATRMVAGGQTVTDMITLTVPSNVPGGDYHYILRLDPQGLITEGSETNNTIASTGKVTMRQADLVIKSVDFVDVATGMPLRKALFGTTGRVLVTAANEGGANATNFKVGVVISADTNLSLLQDTIVVEHDVALLPQGATQTIDITFTLPVNDRAMRPFATGNYFFYGLLDSSGQVTELNEFNNNLVVGGPAVAQAVLVASPAPDLTVLTFDAPSAVGVGEIAPIYRVFKNIGNVDSPEVKYRYYLSANPQVTTDDTPVSIVNGGTMMQHGLVTLTAGQTIAGTELVQLPANITPGTYYLGAVIDTDNVAAELDEANNGLGSMALQVAASSLRVCTPSLPDAVVGRPYSFQLTVCGDAPGMPTTWAVDTAQGALPAGLSLSATGLISGTPTVEAVVGLTFLATNAGRTAQGRLALRVLPTTTQVEITTPSLPSLVNQTTLPYETFLGAAGGAKPYVWRTVPLAGDTSLTTLGLALDPATGRLAGNPRAGLMERSHTVTFEVRDSLGTTSQRQFTLRVISAGAIVFTNLALPDGLVGVDYLSDIGVRNFDGSPLATPLKYRLVAGVLPEGLTLTEEGNVALLQGKAAVAGTFPFTLEVEDNKGRSDSADFLLRIYPARLRVGVNDLANQYRPGDEINFNFVVTGATGVTFALFSGTLPPGATLTSDGKVQGMIASENSEGTYNFVVEAKDATGASGLGAFSVLVKRDPPRQGCSTTGGTFGAWLLALLAPALLFRRKRAAAHVAVALLALAPLAAQAQVTYQVLGPLPITYTSPNAPTNVSAGATVSIPFPFYFYGQLTTSLEFSQYGYLTTSANDTYSANPSIPHSSTSIPPNFIAPWWDLLCTSTTSCPGQQQRWQVFGSAPNRYMVFEWFNFAASTTTAANRFSFQVILYEGTNEIRFAYSGAPGTGSATVGIQRDLGSGIAGLTCTTTSSGNCGPANYQASTMIRFQLPPDLTISAQSMDQVGYAGVTFRATSTVSNLGGQDVTQNKVRYWLSQNATYEATDVLIGDSAPLMNFPANSQTLVTHNANPIPMGTMPGNYYVLSQVDPDNSAPVESNEMNNFGTPQAIQIGPPTPDLVTQSVSAPAMAAPGASVMVGRTFANVGNAAAGAFKYTWFLSSNSVVSISDTPLGSAMQVSDLMPMMGNTQTDSLMLPANLPAGQYWIGACVNYDPQGSPQFGLTEISQVNNCNQAPMPTVVSSGQLAIITPMQLPAATQYSPYGIRLKATGGNGQYAWALASGSSMPPGLTFTAQGDVQGTPAVATSATFSVTVSSGGTDVTQSFSLMIAPGNIPLAIVDQDLPAAEFGRAYSAGLVAVGGKPPYVWKLKMDSRLPNGLAISPEGGIEGRANEAGEVSFGVEVEDSAMTKAAKDLRIRVVNPSTMHIATTKLRTALLKQDYVQQLQAVGGRPPYTWTLLKFQALPQNATEKPGEPLTAFPDNFGIHIEDGNLDYLRGEPKMAGLYAVTFKVVDQASAEDVTTLPLLVSYNEPIAITTTALPDAFIGNDYAAKLSHNRGKESSGIVFSLPCVQQAVSAMSFMCAPMDESQKLPPGLELKDDGSISGLPSSTAGADKVYSFLVKVVDDAGRQDVRSLSIRVRPAITTSGGGGGCAVAGGVPLLALALLAVAKRRVRK